MTKHITIALECGEYSCRVNQYQGCRFAIRETAESSFRCKLFNVSLLSESRHTPTAIYLEAQRCKECMEANLHTNIYTAYTSGGGPATGQRGKTLSPECT
jgi:hypothetical protein